MAQGQMMRLHAEAVSAAEKLFERHNFSLENLALALNCGLKDLTGSIGSLDQLVIEVNSRTLDRLLASMSAEAQLDGPQQKVLTLCQDFLDFCQKHRPFIDLLFKHPFAEDFERPQWYLDQVAACFKPMQNALQALRPGLDGAAYHTCARAVWSQVLGVFTLLENERLPPLGITSKEELVRFNIETFLKGWARF